MQQLIYLQSTQQHVLAQQAIFRLARMEDEHTVLNEDWALKFLYSTILHIMEKRWIRGNHVSKFRGLRFKKFIQCFVVKN